ncbi:glycosyltransferase family 1 protein [Jatrophihabitans sp. DSM 44399]|uniref:Glycosyltransferase family 1 protein n=1 Tax=Jatrophihabitans lederbergiae TaxID=3075547 RepID=A0ABU2J5T5_9ACTN|nr:glycosyltransferase family 1 protein [Jatrophihabitans sp. DSM 44399]MDT0260355.1 glycosyltransferase family 1 protein [Jatrophihabitans sp. DSM 44399]
MPRLLVDATAIPADLRGVGRYLDRLVPALVRAGVDVTAVAQQRDRSHFESLGARCVPGVSVPEGRPARLAWEQYALPSIVARVAPDVLHSPHYTHPLRWRGPLVVTVHDATFFSNPEWHTRAKAPFFRAATRLALRRADVCVVASQATADELTSRLGTAPERLQVAHLGVDTELFHPQPADVRQRVRASIGLAPDEEFVAFLGTLEPRKNVPALIRGWVAACEGRRNPPTLVLAGGAGWDTELDAAVAAVPAGLRLLRAGYVPLEDLPGLLSAATVVSYPSLGEGFGLPVLEAMACGAAVLTTRRLSLPEVGGDAVAYTEPDDAAIGQALSRLLDQPELRAQLSRAGHARAAGFTWAACARAHLRAYETAIRRRSR